MTIAGDRIFLTAEWKNLLMLNYAVHPELLRPFVPANTDLDTHDGKTWMSLIGFEFNKTRVLGKAIPFHQAFEEVNLRFYVKRSERRGVVFIRELVPKFAVTAVARLVYGERYSCVPMDHSIDTVAGRTIAEYSWGTSSRRCTFSAQTEGDGYLPHQDSLSQFITEHYWGYAAQKTGATMEYQVEHPQWKVRNTTRPHFTGNAEMYYGSEFAKVLDRTPDSAFLADGSPVTVLKGERIGKSSQVHGPVVPATLERER